MTITQVPLLRPDAPGSQEVAPPGGGVDAGEERTVDARLVEAREVSADVDLRRRNGHRGVPAHLRGPHGVVGHRWLVGEDGVVLRAGVDRAPVGIHRDGDDVAAAGESLEGCGESRDGVDAGEVVPLDPRILLNEPPIQTVAPSGETRTSLTLPLTQVDHGTMSPVVTPTTASFCLAAPSMVSNLPPTYSRSPYTARTSPSGWCRWCRPASR